MCVLSAVLHFFSLRLVSFYQFVVTDLWSTCVLELSIVTNSSTSQRKNSLFLTLCYYPGRRHRGTACSPSSPETINPRTKLTFVSLIPLFLFAKKKQKKTLPCYLLSSCRNVLIFLRHCLALGKREREK